MVTVRPKTVDFRGMRLSPEEGFVLSRLDAPLTMKDLVVLTGLEEARVREIVLRLVEEGAVDIEGSLAPEPEPLPELEVIGPVDPEEALPELEVIGPVDPEEALPELEVIGPVDPEEALPELEVIGPVDPEEEAQEAAAEEDRPADREYRKIYETKFRGLDREARVLAAAGAEGGELMALCHDADPQVIHAVFTNPKVGLDHARLIAFHHHTHVGLEMVGRRSDFLADSQVQRRLLGNPQLPETLLGRIIHPKLLTDVYKISINREIPERSRIKTRSLLQKKFMIASADERAALIIKTEARCLMQLVDCAIDARTTQILCGKTTYSILFIQNVARWSATPPQLLKHLLRQQVVRQNPGLRKLLLKHANVPSDVKRSLY
jgi:hypothetical protein